MDKSKLRQIVQAKVEKLRWALQLQDWKLDVEYCHIGDRDDDESIVGNCTPRLGYRCATIKLDPEHIHEDEDVIEILRHELLHLIHADLTLLMDAIEPHIQRDGFKTIQRIYWHAIEKIVGNIERMLDNGLGLSPDRMIQLSAKRGAK